MKLTILAALAATTVTLPDGVSSTEKLSSRPIVVH
jgi:hypothetical protein